MQALPCTLSAEHSVGRPLTTPKGACEQSTPWAVVMLVGAACLAAWPLPASATNPPPGDNFKVVGTDTARCLDIAGDAEAVRVAAYRLLLGDEDPAPWRSRCVIHVHPSPQSFAAAVGGLAATTRGATSLEFSADRVTMRRIDVIGDGPDTVPDGLAHEIVHVVLADRFIEAAPPRWADEGIALLFDPVGKQLRHDADFRAALERDLTWSATDLLALEDYPAEPGRQRVYYGQSAALVRWLVARRDTTTFVMFVDDCRRLGPAAALKRHYDIDSLADLERAWREPVPISDLARAPSQAPRSQHSDRPPH